MLRFRIVRMLSKDLAEEIGLVFLDGAQAWKSYTKKEISPAEDNMMKFDLAEKSLHLISSDMPVQKNETDLLSQIL